MLAIPLDAKDATVISTYYGNAPFFALLDEETGAFTVIENSECGNGIDGANFLKDKGITSTIFYHMGEGLYKLYTENGIDVFTCKKELMSLDRVYTGFLQNNLQKLDSSNYKELLDSGNGPCKCGCENG
jgi:predicted Fe-Mo cluster-binding NifX family protein